MIIGGKVVEGTLFVHRSTDAWWSWSRLTDRPDLRLRKGQVVDVLGGHWTGGPIREGEDAAVRTVAAMRMRERKDGSLMDVSCHFVIGWDGCVWQVADIEHATVHIGGGLNIRSIGVETTWPGYASQAIAIRDAMKKNGRTPHPAYEGQVDARVMAHQQKIWCLRPSIALVDGWLQLAEALAALPPETGVQIPRQLARVPEDTRVRSGAIEHWQAPGADKDDAAGYLLDVLRGAGWSG